MSIYIMCENNPVIEFDMEDGLYKILNDSLVPFTLRDVFKNSISYEDVHSKYDDTLRTRINNNNYNAIVTWLSHRVLSLSRENAKKIYNLLELSQAQDEVSKAKIALMCRATSVEDNYWVKPSDDSSSWEDKNLRHVHLNEIVTQVALHGKSLTFTGQLCTPEISTFGTYAKGWVREEDGLYLHKVGANGNTESRIEVMCSNLLDKMNISHVRYVESEHDGVYTCKCKCMTDDSKSRLTAEDFGVYCNRMGWDFYDKVIEVDPESIFKMWIVDYLIANRDRHSQNWGFYYDSRNMDILGCHPLFDHNNAFDTDFMVNPDSPYAYGNNMTMRQAAIKAMKFVDFHFTKPIVKQDFITDKQYKCFMERATELGIKTVNEFNPASIMEGK